MLSAMGFPNWFSAGSMASAAEDFDRAWTLKRDRTVLLQYMTALPAPNDGMRSSIRLMKLINCWAFCVPEEPTKSDTSILQRRTT